MSVLTHLSVYILALVSFRVFGDFRTAAFGFFEQYFQRSIAVAVMAGLSQQSLEAHSQEKVGSIMSTIERGLGSARGLAYEVLNVLSVYVIQLLISAIVLVYHYRDWYIFLSFLLFVISIALIPFVLRSLNLAQREAIDTFTKAQGYLTDLMTNFETVQVYQLQEPFNKLYSKDLELSVSAWKRFHSTRIRWSIFQYVLMLTGVLWALSLSVFMFWEKRYTIGDIAMLDMYLLSMIRPFDNLGFAVRQIQRSSIAIEGLLKLLARTKSQNSMNESKLEPASLSDGIRFLDVSLVLNRTKLNVGDSRIVDSKERKALQGVSLFVEPGEFVALVGPSGSGKTSVLRTLAGLYPGYDGSVQVWGREVAHFSSSLTGAEITYVGQESQMFNESIYFNLTLGRQEITREHISEVCTLMQLDELLHRLPDGLNTILGERGARLSGGERQRVALVRALLRDATVFILDEATSALDYVTEARILKNLRQYLQGKTILLAAHRLSSIVDVDRIFVMHLGSVKETGRHLELLKQQGLYTQLWNAQISEDEAVKPV